MAKVERKGLFVRIVSGHRITLPEQARAALGVKVGDYVRIEIVQDRLLVDKAE